MGHLAFTFSANSKPTNGNKNFEARSGFDCFHNVFEARVAYWVVAEDFTVVDYTEGSESAW
jgi:hypothetical protein